MTKVDLIGAGGKMGCRLTNNLKKSAYSVSYVEVSQEGIDRLTGLGVSISDPEDVVPEADIVILAVPDVLLGKISGDVIPKMQSGAIVMFLDPAVAMAKKHYHREDVSYFITHPTHPSVFNWEPTPEAQADYFGGVLAKQSMVCALLHGNDKDYERGEELAKVMYGPIVKSYRITVEQMALLEPALVETLASSCMAIIKEGMDEIIKKGVPEDAARAFLLGHLNIQLAIIFGEIPGAAFSDAAYLALARGKRTIFQQNWKKVFDPDDVLDQVNEIT